MLLSPLFVGYIDKCKCWLFLEIIVFLEVIETLDKQIGIRFDFVNIILKENDNFDLTLRKRLFCDAKPTLLPCKTAAFGTQNNRFCNALTASKLHDRHACEKYLHTFRLLSAYQKGNIAVFSVWSNGNHLLLLWVHRYDVCALYMAFEVRDKCF